MTARKLFLLFIVLVESFALIAPFVLHVQAGQATPTQSLIRFFSYFTFLTNLLVAVYATVLLLTPDGKKAGFFFSASTQTAITLYIIEVGLIYNILLRQLWDAAGLKAVLHDLLHTLMPLLMLIYWWKWPDAKTLQGNNIPTWLLNPRRIRLDSFYKRALAKLVPLSFP